MDDRIARLHRSYPPYKKAGSLQQAREPGLLEVVIIRQRLGYPELPHLVDRDSVHQRPLLV